MHRIQEKLLEEINRANLSGMPLREIGRLVGEDSPQKIKHHLQQLSKKGFIVYQPQDRLIEKKNNSSSGQFLSIPIMGSANCGPATIFAEQNIVGYLKVTKSMLPKNSSQLYVLRAVGNSMNRSNVNGKSIEDGDFVIVDSEQRSPGLGDYVVSVIDDVANIKKFSKEGAAIVLRSESSEEHFPVFVHEDDKFEISGKVIDVFKK